MVQSRREDWEFYREPYDPGKWIREAGDTIYDVLFRIMGNTDNTIRATEYLMYAAFIPTDYKSFRGLTAYIARKAAENGLCFVVSPILKFPCEDYNIVVNDWEFALIPKAPVGTIGEIHQTYMEDRGYV